MDQPGAMGAKQLYQALAWLKPLEGSQQMGAWSSLYSRLHRLVPKPSLHKPTPPRCNELYVALTSLGLHFQAQASCGEYRGDAVLTAHGSSAQAILMLERPQDFFTNDLTR